MRQIGTLTDWKDDKGFGFITPVGVGTKLFVHVSEFERGPRRPRVPSLGSDEPLRKPRDGSPPARGRRWISSGGKEKGPTGGPFPSTLTQPQNKSNRSDSITLFHARTKSRTNFGCESLAA